MLALMGYSMIVVFVVLVMTKKMSALSALIIIPVVFAAALGYSDTMGKMIVDGMRQVAPTGVMLIFAILYFGIMIDSGLFDPLIRCLLRIVHNDPVRITLGTVALASTVALDGDGTSTFLICVTAMFPVYRRIGMSPYVLACCVLLSIGVMNLLPWGGHTTRAMAALHLPSEEVFLPIVPIMAVGLVYAFVAAYFMGRAERRRLGTLQLGASSGTPQVDSVAELHAIGDVDAQHAQQLLRPKLVWFNAALTLALLVGLVTNLLPMLVLFMLGFTAAIMVNYPSLQLQKERIGAHAANVLSTVALLFASGIFTGILNGTGMVEAMAHALVQVIPDLLGSQMALITCGISMVFTYFMANDPYYFGVLPVIAETAQAYGVPAVEIARASVLGQPVHVLSPLFAALYLLVSLLGIDFAETQRFAIKWAVGSSVCMAASAVLFGVISI